MLVALATTSLACGGGGSSSSSSSGSAEVAGLAIKDAAFGSAATPLGAVVVIGLSELPGACESAQQALLPKGASAVTVVLGRADGKAVGPGEYQVWVPGAGVMPTMYGVVDLSKTDLACRNTLTPEQSQASAGTVRIESVALREGGRAKGSLAARFGDGSRLDGTFDASFCALPSDILFTTPGCP